MSGTTAPPRADRRRFSLHEEEDVTEVPRHRLQVEYLETNLRASLPDRFVAGNMGVYWVPGQLQKPWVGPDVLVSAHIPIDPKPRVYLVWEDGPIQFVGEVASDRTRRSERKKRAQNYQVDLQVPEYLYVDLDRRQLELARLHDGAYRRVPLENGRLYSQELNVWFGWDLERDFVRIWTADGRMLRAKEEDLEALQEAELRAQEAESRAAELAAEVERLRRAAGGGPADVAP